MRSSAELKRHYPASQSPSFGPAPLPLVEPVDDPSRPARGIVIACCISLAFWLAILGLLV